MKYQFIGSKIPYYGKTMWEIVANLKDFGVGRLVRECTWDDLKKPRFLKIVKVQALPPSRQPFEERLVQTWVEEYHKGVYVGIKLKAKTKFPRYILIPKIEEEIYYKALDNISDEEKKKYLRKYCVWPPGYKLIWQQTAEKQYGPIPSLKSVHSEYSGYEIVLEDKFYEHNTCSLYKSDMTVEEMYKEIVHLKKLIDSSNASN